MPKLIIIDGNSLLFRSYFATAYPGVEIMRTKSGVPTNAIFAFSNMINKIIANLKEDESIFVAFDAGKPTFRHEALETYKANRKPTPTDLVEQFSIAREFLTAMNIYQFEKEGVEGDDIAGTIAKKAVAKGYDVILYTSDRDFIQLVSEKININIIRKGLSDVVTMTPDLVMETYGFTPTQIIDYKGLRGDSSDNLPGIPGIGEKTAIKLIQEYGNFDSIMEHAEEIGGKVGKNLIENKELGTLCRDLAIIKSDVELPFDVEDLSYQGYSFTKINEFCRKYELKQFASKVCPKWKKNDDEAVMNIEVETVSKITGLMTPNEIGVALDMEEGDYERNDVFGIAFNIEGKHLYLSLDDLKHDQFALDILKNPNVKKYCYDYKAIKVALNRYGVQIEGCIFDILIATYILDSSIANSKESVFHYYGYDLGQKEEVSLLSSGNPTYTALIALYSRLLYQKIKKELEKISAYDLFKDLEIPLIDTLANMEIEGFPLDGDKLEELGSSYRSKVKELEEEIYSLANEKFNIASPKQVASILFDKLGLPNYKRGSTSSEILNDIKNFHPIVNKILAYRKYFKLVTTYIDGLKPHIFNDGKIHAKFNQALTATGRLSSSEPNLQNISIRDEEGKLIRKAFYYKEEGYSILSLDYSQIELRILASMSNCKALQDIFLSGEDIHSATAKKVFHLEGEPTSLQRRKAKAVNFGIIYGISDWGLAEQLEIPIKEAKEIINEFYNSFPEVSTFFQEIVMDATENGYVSTLLGRRRYLAELYDSNYQKREFAKRAAMNAPIQGSAADLIKLAMISVNRLLKENKLETKMVLQIHDELIFKVPEKEKDKVYNLIKEAMEHAMDLSVGLEVDGGFGLSWYECK